MEFHFTLIRKSESDIMMYNTFYRLVKASQGNESSIMQGGEEWRNAADNKMSMSAELARAVVEAVKKSV